MHLSLVPSRKKWVLYQDFGPIINSHFILDVGPMFGPAKSEFKFGIYRINIYICYVCEFIYKHFFFFAS